MDRVTNIAWKTTSGTILGGFAYDDRLSSDGGVSYTYDAAGNRTTIDNTKARESCWESFASRICDGRRGYNSGESEGLG